MSKALKVLIFTAGVIVDASIEAIPELEEALDAVNVAVGEDENLNMGSAEAKQLKEVVDMYSDEYGDEIEEALAGEAGEADEAKKAKKAKRLNYEGVKQIGSQWYHSGDKYKKAYVTADECATANNG